MVCIVKCVKFIYSEKATKFCKIFFLLLTVCTVVKSKGKIFQNFLAFSEYMNFTAFSLTHYLKNAAFIKKNFPFLFRNGKKKHFLKERWKHFLDRLHFTKTNVFIFPLRNTTANPKKSFYIGCILRKQDFFWICSSIASYKMLQTKCFFLCTYFT